MEFDTSTIIIGVCLLAAILAAPVWKICSKIIVKGGVSNKLKNVDIGGDYTGRDNKK
jgi:hypothetical protein